MAIVAKYPQLNETELTPHARAVLVRILRVAFPHDRFPDGPFDRTAEVILAQAKESTWLRVTLTQGLASLDTLAGGDFTLLNAEDATAVLKSIERTDFFGFVRRTAVLNLYDDVEVWDAVGYEGASFDQGGYLNRGFADLDWLPEPRIEEYDGEPLNPLPAHRGGRAPDAAPPVGGSQPGAVAAQHEGVGR